MTPRSDPTHSESPVDRGKYRLVLTFRPSYMGPDDWHFKAVRKADGAELWLIYRWRWVGLRWLTERRLDRKFKAADRHARFCRANGAEWAVEGWPDV